MPHSNDSKSYNFFLFSTIKILVLIISGNIYGNLSGNIPTVIINQLSDAIFDKENNFSGNYE